MLNKRYDHIGIEERIYKHWETKNFFQCGVRKKAEQFSIVIPPPNVTGNLHMGHALNNTLQDIIIRFERLRGKDVLWQPGTDHAGIATQMVVEKQLSKRGIDRHKIGRENFIKEVWEWKNESGDVITQQLKRLGSSCDWSRERFTMDEGLSKAVQYVFVELYNSQLIYKDKRLVNWDPKLQTAVSDLEVLMKEEKGELWHLKYPLFDNKEEFIIVATTRPETMLGDTAVAVHPSDDRYKKLIGRYVILPIAQRKIPIIADEFADPEKGSGAVKITPAHDFNDFQVGQRHRLENINILDARGFLNDQVPAKYQGLERFKARKIIVQDMKDLGLLEKIEELLHPIPYGDRSNVVIEPRLTEQWFVDAKTLSIEAIKAVEEGKTKFVPKNWENTYFEWMRNIEPWCISRQLWWGHQIPAWYGPDKEIFVANSEIEAKKMAERHYGKETELIRDQDVLDTWFSSALWPFSTLGWPEDTDEFKKYYSTNLLVTGFDIIFFWVARMMMMGLHFTKKVPFHNVFVHALVRDESGQKMSKSKGNVIDPLNLIDKFGADALRFTLAAMTAQGRDIKLSEKRVEGYRNFFTKLWNVSRFCEMNKFKMSNNYDYRNCENIYNQWIISEFINTEKNVKNSLEDYRFNDAANAIYDFIWHKYCDWYVEFIKPQILEKNGKNEETSSTALWILNQSLILLHPFAPFITEELWEKISIENSSAQGSLILSKWPNVSSSKFSKNLIESFGWLIDTISAIRSARAELNVPAKSILSIKIKKGSQDAIGKVRQFEKTIARMARVNVTKEQNDDESGCVQIVVKDLVFLLALGEIIDLNKEKNRLEKEYKKVEMEIKRINNKLNNKSFVEKAPEEIITKQKLRLDDYEKLRNNLINALNRFSK